MSATWGKHIRLTIFGESHGKCVGGVIDGLEPGRSLPTDLIDRELKRRKPGSAWTTERKEDDDYEILSGLHEGKTTGAPLTVIFKNRETRSRDYEELRRKPRPSHADYVSWVKYGGYGDHRGGGRFSGRLTAFLVFAGALAKDILAEEEKIVIGSHLLRLGPVSEERFPLEMTSEKLAAMGDAALPFEEKNRREEARSYLEALKLQKDSAGAVVETMALGVPPGWGEPFFDSVEGSLSKMLFAIPGVKGVDFGLGFEFGDSTGSEANDAFCMKGDSVATITNNSGGINGGITNGMPLVFRTVFRPTPSIGTPQETVDLETMENGLLAIEGRHDPCIALRALPVVEAVLALVLLEFHLEKGGRHD